jgi:hypothetical protein
MSPWALLITSQAVALFLLFSLADLYLEVRRFRPIGARLRAFSARYRWFAAFFALFFGMLLIHFFANLPPNPPPTP